MDIASLTAVNKINPVSFIDSQNMKPISSPSVDHSGFGSLLTKAMDSLSATNEHVLNAQREEIRWALGETTNTHALTYAMQKSSIAMQYTIAIRDKVLEAYKEIMQISI